MKISYKDMIAGKIAAFDVLGHRIHRVRSVEAVEGGIQVSVLHNTHYKTYPVCGYTDEEGSDQGKGVVEFSAFVGGGYIGPRPEGE